MLNLTHLPLTDIIKLQCFNCFVGFGHFVQEDNISLSINYTTISCDFGNINETITNIKLIVFTK